MKRFSLLACLVALLLFAGMSQASGRILRTIRRVLAPAPVIVAPAPVYVQPQIQSLQGYGACGVQGFQQFQSGVYGGQSFRQLRGFQGQRFRRGGAQFIRIGGQLYRVR